MNRRIENLASQRGVVSLFTVIFVTILLITMTTAFIRLMTSAQRRATDNDLSTRALYAAEAGIDDALAQANDALRNGRSLANEFDDDCGDEVVLDGGFDTSYTCKFVSFESVPDEGIIGSLAPDQSYNVDIPNPGGAIRVLLLQWHRVDRDGPFPTTGANTLPTSTAPNPSQYRNRSDWPTLNWPALMRFQVIQLPSNNIGGFASSTPSITNDITFTYPRDSSTFSNINIDENIATAPCGFTGSTIDGYSCQANYIVNPSQENVFVNIRAINNSTNFQLTAFDASGNKLTIGSRLYIDVTGRAGNVFRRVRVGVPVDGSGRAAEGLGDPNLNNVLLVDDYLCKDIEVSGSVTNLCPPNN